MRGPGRGRGPRKGQEGWECRVALEGEKSSMEYSAAVRGVWLKTLKNELNKRRGFFSSVWK